MPNSAMPARAPNGPPAAARWPASPGSDLTGARQEFGKRLRITLNGVAQAGHLRQAIEPFVAVAQSEPQAMPVVVEYMNAQGSCTVELGENWRVRPQEDLLAEVRHLLHARMVAVEY